MKGLPLFTESSRETVRKVLEAAHYYDEQSLAALIIEIALINVFNRLNVTVRYPEGANQG